MNVFFPLAITVLSAFVKIVNCEFCLHQRHRSKMLFSTAMNCIGIIFVIIGKAVDTVIFYQFFLKENQVILSVVDLDYVNMGYIITIIGILIIGSMTSFSQFTLLGFFKDLHHKHLINFGVGVGFSSFLSAIFWIIVSGMEFDAYKKTVMIYVLFIIKQYSALLC